MDPRSDRSLTELLQEYADGVRRLPVPPASRDLAPIERELLGRGARAVDRLGQGLTEDELNSFQASVGVNLPPQLREWFSWANGHLPSVFDPDDNAACLFPFGRQMDVAAGTTYLNSIAVAMHQQDPPFPTAPVVVLQAFTRTFMVDCATDEGAVWLWDVTSIFEPVFSSLREMVLNGLSLLRHDLVRLDFLGGAFLARPQELEARGLAFASDWERFRYQSYGCLPSTLSH